MTAFLRQFRYLTGESRLTVLALALFVFLLLLAVFGPVIAPYDPLAGNMAYALQPPSQAHWCGTDPLGRDVLSRIIAAMRLDLGIAVTASILSFVIGSGLGSLAGFYGGWPDWIVGRVTDTITAFPLFVLAMGIVASLDSSVVNMIYAMAIISLPVYVRVSRAEAHGMREAGFVASARLYGNNGTQLLIRQLLPNILPAIMAQVAFSTGWAMLHVAGLSFIGLGVGDSAPEWGRMMAEGVSLMAADAWWLILFPGFRGAQNLVGGGLA